MNNAHYRGDAFLIVRGAAGPRGNPSERPVLVFQCYLDDSGTSGLPIVTMAGFFAAQARWELAEPAFDEILTRYEVPVLHAKEFHSTRDTFKGWSKIKKRTLAKEVFGASHGSLLGVSVTVPKTEIEAWKKETGELPQMSALGICFATILMKLVTDPRVAQATRQEGVSFLIESGNPNNPGLEQYFHKMAKQPAFKGALRSISFVTKDSCRAIQVADFFAYYSRRHMRDYARFQGKIALPKCPYLEIMKKHGPILEWGGRGTPQITDQRIDKVADVNDLASFLKKADD